MLALMLLSPARQYSTTRSTMTPALVLLCFVARPRSQRMPIEAPQLNVICDFRASELLSATPGFATGCEHCAMLFLNVLLNTALLLSELLREPRKGLPAECSMLETRGLREPRSGLPAKC